MRRSIDSQVKCQGSCIIYSRACLSLVLCFFETLGLGNYTEIATLPLLYCVQFQSMLYFFVVMAPKKPFRDIPVKFL